jgi:dTDP-glucose 4,6-dehydratase
MAITVDWYKKFGERWWGDITEVLTPFPTVAGTEVIADSEPVEDIKEDMVMGRDNKMTLEKKRKVDGTVA